MNDRLLMRLPRNDHPSIVRCKYAVLLAFIAACSNQKVLLVGTHHTTPEARLNEVVSIAEAIEHFAPEIFCVEYPIPTDTPSLQHLGGDLVFKNMEARRISWGIPANHALAIRSLQQHLNDHPRDLKKRMELQQHYFLSHDKGNSDYQGYRIFKALERDSLMAAMLAETFTGYETLKSHYDRGGMRNSEYHILVFPLAAKLNIPYLYPIDDQSTMKSYAKFFQRTQVRDTTDSVIVRHHRRVKDFFDRLNTLSIDSNQWILTNSRSFMRELLVLEGYSIGGDSVNEDFRMRHHYWVLRNKAMAQHIDNVARRHSKKDVAVFFGVSHVGAVAEALKRLKKRYRVLTLPDIKRP